MLVKREKRIELSDGEKEILSKAFDLLNDILEEVEEANEHEEKTVFEEDTKLLLEDIAEYSTDAIAE